MKKKYDYIAGFLLVLSLLMLYIDIPFVNQRALAQFIMIGVAIYLFIK